MSQKTLIETWDSFPLSPATDVPQLHSQISANPSQWQAVADFLQGNDLTCMELGRHEITEDGTYANVQDYTTKSESEALFEGHRKYIDVQIVVKGAEDILVAPVDSVGAVTVEYSESSDIMFWRTAGAVRAVAADSDNWVVLFPSDVHKPCITKGDMPAEMRKIVVKIPYSE